MPVGIPSSKVSPNTCAASGPLRPMYALSPSTIGPDDMSNTSLRSIFAAGAIAAIAVDTTSQVANAGITSAYMQGTIDSDATGLGLHGLTAFADCGWIDDVRDSFASPTVGGYFGSILYVNLCFSNRQETFFASGCDGNAFFVDALSLPAQDSVSLKDFDICATSSSLNVTDIQILLGNSGIDVLTTDDFTLEQATTDAFATGLRRITVVTPSGNITIAIDTIVVFPPCPTDLSGDGLTDAEDLAILLGVWGTPHMIADINADGTVDGSDLAALLGSWGDCQ
jgi:hypothetical protein